MNGNGALRPTRGVEWRRAHREGYVLTLPSGNVVRMRPVALDVLIVSGRIPDFLTAVAAKSLWTETSGEEIASRDELAKGFAELVNIIVPAALLEPKVVEDPQGDDEVSLEDIDFQDKVSIFQLAVQPSEVLRKFRDQQDAGVATVSDGEDNGDEAE